MQRIRNGCCDCQVSKGLQHRKLVLQRVLTRCSDGWLANRGNHCWVATVQAALQSDQGIGALQSNNLNFERWIKHGLTAEELMNSSNLSAEVPSQGCSLPLLTTRQTSLLAECTTQAPVVI